MYLLDSSIFIFPGSHNILNFSLYLGSQWLQSLPPSIKTCAQGRNLAVVTYRLSRININLFLFPWELAASTSEMTDFITLQKSFTWARLVKRAEGRVMVVVIDLTWKEIILLWQQSLLAIHLAQRLRAEASSITKFW